jgi:cytoskeletal protein RodZ
MKEVYFEYACSRLLRNVRMYQTERCHIPEDSNLHSRKTSGFIRGGKSLNKVKDHGLLKKGSAVIVFLLRCGYLILQEVDEENIEESPTNQTTAGAASRSELDINSKFEEFWRVGREKAKEKKLRRAKETRKSESDSGNVPTPTPTPTSTIITPTITMTPPNSSTNKSRPSL